MPRTIEERIADVRKRLHDEVNVWVASANESGEAYLIPLSFYWDGTRLTVATPKASRTARNLMRAGYARVALARTSDAVILEGPVVARYRDDIDAGLADALAARAGFDARTQVEEYVYLQLAPQKVLAWRGPSEFTGRVVMRAGRWLANEG
ncbi:MAG TPA: pyridoxamine 5'-phosphate oxidase family protein [Thermomicrobiaceae bacterium]|nr:pyridoxamine 5'-phosphate oxidase family protein [Thermomicrobiaceae bacterium]